MSTILYNYFRSSTSYRVRIALHYKCIPFEYRAVNLLKGEHLKPEYLNISPLGEVPCLQYQNFTISQSLPIIEFLDEVFPNAPLIFGSPSEKARIRQFCENINSFLHPLSNLKVLKYLELKHSYQQLEKEVWVQNWAQHCFQSLEHLVLKSNTEFCLGPQLTAADIFLVPALFSARRFNVELTSFSKLLAIEETLLQREDFKQAHPNAQIDCV